MLPATRKKSNPKHPTKNSRVRFPGIMSDASVLGVDRIHLFRVLKGERQSASLLRRYRALKSRGGKPGRDGHDGHDGHHNGGDGK